MSSICPLNKRMPIRESIVRECLVALADTKRCRRSVIEMQVDSRLALGDIGIFRLYLIPIVRGDFEDCATDDRESFADRGYGTHNLAPYCRATFLTADIHSK